VWLLEEQTAAISNFESFLKDKRGEKFVGRSMAGDTTCIYEFIPPAVYTYMLCTIYYIKLYF
jgi:hypothetical protein